MKDSRQKAEVSKTGCRLLIASDQLQIVKY